MADAQTDEVKRSMSNARPRRKTILWIAPGILVAGILVAVWLWQSQKPSAEELQVAVGFHRRAEVSELLAKGADPNASDRVAHLRPFLGLFHIYPDWPGPPPLFMALNNGGDAEIVRNLLKHGADANASLFGQGSVLLTASRAGNRECIRALLDHGANPDFQDGNGCTALWCAAGYGDTVTIRLLIAHGANPRIKDTRGQTPLAKAIASGHAKAVELLGGLQSSIPPHH